MASPRFIQLHREDSAALRLELARGLLATPAMVSPKFLYDALGSRLFDAITELPEYYPTRTERAIFEAHAQAMAACIGPGRTMIDLGAGNCEKAARLFGVDVKAKRQAIKADKLSQLRDEYRKDPAPSNTQYGWVWLDEGREPTVPVGS